MRAADLVGVAEIASRLDVTKATVSTWRARGLLPRPVAVLGCGPIWSWPQVSAWADKSGRANAVRSGDVTAADMRDAAEVLADARETCRAELREAAYQVRHLATTTIRRPAPRAAVRDASGRLSSNDGRGNGNGSWDWFYGLSASERKRLGRRLSSSPDAVGPDVYAQSIGAHVVGGEDLDRVMAEWVRATAILDAFAAVRAGKVPTGPIPVETTHDARELFGPDAVEYLARQIADERDQWAEIAELDAYRASEPEEETPYEIEEVF